MRGNIYINRLEQTLAPVKRRLYKVPNGSWERSNARRHCLLDVYHKYVDHYPHMISASPLLFLGFSPGQPERKVAADLGLPNNGSRTFPSPSRAKIRLIGMQLHRSLVRLCSRARTLFHSSALGRGGNSSRRTCICELTSGSAPCARSRPRTSKR
jgi:hypothetical protein